MGTRITAIGGYHHYRKDNKHVEKLEFVSSWSKHLPDGFGEFFPSLTEFEVRDTPLEKLRRSNFASMNNLVILAIENTRLTSIPGDAFDEIVNLEELKITKSQLRTLSPLTFAPLLKLRSFDGKYNRITRLDYDLFTNNTRLESINLNRNDICEIDTDFSKLENLIEVYLFKCSCINSYFLKSNSIFTLESLKTLIKKRCSVKRKRVGYVNRLA